MDVGAASFLIVTGHARFSDKTAWLCRLGLMMWLFLAPAYSLLADEATSVQVGLSSESQAVYQARVLPFLKENCWKCHDRKTAKAGFIVEDLGTDFLEGKTGDHWREAVDQINLGKMPKKGKVDPQEAFRIVEWVNQELRNAAKRAHSTGGRVPMRRLNRTEYANTVCDLFHLDSHLAGSIARDLPADGHVDGFDRGGAALLVDVSQLQAYLDMARVVVDEALPAAAPKLNKQRLTALDDTSITRRDKKMLTIKEMLDLGDAQLDTVLSDPKELAREIERGPGMNDFNIARDGGVELCMGSMAFVAQSTNVVRKIVTKDGWYKIRIRAGADRGRGKFAADAVRVTADYCKASKEHRKHLVFTIDAPLDRPKVYEQTVFLRAGGPDFQEELRFFWNPYHPWGGYHDADNTVIPDAQLRKLYWACRGSGGNYSSAKEKKDPKIIAAAKKKRDGDAEAMRQFALTFKGPAFHVNPAMDPKSMPRLWYDYVDIEGPLSEFPTQTAKELLSADSQGGSAQTRAAFARFLPRAYRRPVSAAEVESLVQVVEAAQSSRGKNFPDAMRDAVVTVLTSPNFLYLQEPAGPTTASHVLTDYELASRLSYFLWSTMPDEALMNLAARNKLHDPATLRAQVRRMAVDPRARQFVENFVGQWTRAREFDSAVVDTRQYPAYDDALRDSGLAEPYEFFSEMLRSDLSLLNAIQSDFLVIDERLAKHYGIAGVVGDEFRRVPLAPGSQRGGLLGMAAMLTYLADGSRTLPVKRGAYVLDVFWNRPPPPPPPNVGDLPVIKGKNLTVRQRLEQHRSMPNCASCHSKIDPLGLALENYDAVGAWRERQNGERRTGGKGDPPIDPSGVMPDGKTFKTLAEFKQVMLEEKGKFLQGFTEKLLAYALGRPIGATDRELVDKIVFEAAKEDYRLQSFLQAIVADREFQTK
jgi:hypothetical protein